MSRPKPTAEAVAEVLMKRIAKGDTPSRRQLRGVLSKSQREMLAPALTHLIAARMAHPQGGKWVVGFPSLFPSIDFGDPEDTPPA